jgi:hypothetical protein
MRGHHFCSRNAILVVTIRSVVVIASADYATGCQVGFYFIAIAASKLGTTKSNLILILSAIFWSLSDVYSSHPYSNLFFVVFNGIIRLLAFLSIAYSALKIQRFLEKPPERSPDCLRQVKTLMGLIPISENRETIRAQEETWQQIEEYVVELTNAELTNAEFTHAVCTECVRTPVKQPTVEACLIQKQAWFALVQNAFVPQANRFAAAHSRVLVR